MLKNTNFSLHVLFNVMEDFRSKHEATLWQEWHPEALAGNGWSDACVS